MEVPGNLFVCQSEALHTGEVVVSRAEATQLPSGLMQVYGMINLIEDWDNLGTKFMALGVIQNEREKGNDVFLFGSSEDDEITIPPWLVPEEED